jgi:hypothetical protein
MRARARAMLLDMLLQTRRVSRGFAIFNAQCQHRALDAR